MKIKVLNKREVKKIINLLREQYSIKEVKLDRIFLLGKDDKLYLIDGKLADLDTDNLRINSLGLYFGRLEHGKVRLSIEGSQLIGPLAKKNVVNLSKSEVNEWVRGNDLNLRDADVAVTLVRFDKDFFGSGKNIKGKLLNFVPKSRRIRASANVQLL